MAGRKKTKTIKGKSELWDLYKNANPLVRLEIQMTLKQYGLQNHWLNTASQITFNLHHAPWPLRDVFVRLIPESKPLFEKHHETTTTQQNQT